MDKLDFNIGLVVFITGALLFLIAPLGLFGAAYTNDLHLLALGIESLGVVTGAVVYFRKEIIKLDL